MPYSASDSWQGKVIKNTFWLGLAEVVSRLTKLVLIIFAARILGAQDFGAFSFAMAFAALFLFLADFGLIQIVTREFARGSRVGSAPAELAGLLSLKLILVVITLAAIFVFSFAAVQAAALRHIIWVFGLTVVSHSFGELLFSVLRARQQMFLEALTRILDAVIVAVLGFAVLLEKPSALLLAAAYFIGALFATLYLTFVFNRQVYPLKIQFTFSLWQKYLAFSWPLALVSVFVMLHNQIDTVMLGLFGQITETGWYNAAYRLAGGTLLASALINQVFFPAMSRNFLKNKEQFQKIWSAFLTSQFALALPLAVGGIVLAGPVINFLYGAEFSPSIFAFQILIVMAGLVFLNNGLSRLLLVADLQKANFFITMAGVGLNIALNLILIPRFSLYGAAIATLITFGFLFLLFFLVAQAKLRQTLITVQVMREGIGILLAGAAMFGMIKIMVSGNLHLLVVIPSAVVIYFAAFLIFRFFIHRTMD